MHFSVISVSSVLSVLKNGSVTRKSSAYQLDASAPPQHDAFWCTTLISIQNLKWEEIENTLLSVSVYPY